eukprot:CAMPEP_0113489216 /NCGR_PEP_ID=MMETSP0014_2-20120614/26415_1 /TAXON_ID=2857 /ORGANISM="Nitzschia sp." /LENGTH=821 /DNA_ID=CAMNT_0000382947 /DNA_START=110 /DNA_END=2572 /DNA_ORIENTATION=+ /assembly_acc=CAM_ASM_000159
MQVDWELSHQFVSDGQGIRGVCVLPPLDGDGTGAGPGPDAYRVVTGTQGGGMCEFGVPSGSIRPIEYQHNNTVSAILADPDGQFYVTGCKDAIIRIFDAKTHQLLSSLSGHEKPVTSLSFVRTDGGTTTATSTAKKLYLVSGSWDGTAKIWDLDRRCLVATFPGHENTVSVTGLAPGQTKSGGSSTVRVATGSAGRKEGNQVVHHTVRIWTCNVQTGQVQCVSSVANDHEGSIRGITALPSCLATADVSSSLMVTCSNDGTVRMRSSDDASSISALTFLQQNASHPPFLLSVTSVGSEGDTTYIPTTTDAIAASAEDGHVIVWNQIGGGGGGGDSGGASSGGSEPQIIMHPGCVWAVTSLPKGDIATCCDDGTLRIFTKATDRMAPVAEKEAFHQAVQAVIKKQQSGPSSAEIAKLPLWENNLATRGRSEGDVQMFNKDGVAVAAQWSATSQTWIFMGEVVGSKDGGVIDGVQYDHVLPIEVDQQGGGVANLQIGYNNGENPFNAAQRFIDAHMLPQHHLNEIADYIQQRVGTQTPTLGGGVTSGPSSYRGGGGGSAAATTGVPMVTYQNLPMAGYKSFELSSKTAATTLDKMKTKISEFGKLSDQQLAALTSLIETLAATNRYHASKVSSDELKLILDMLSFPPSEAFPALDLARLAVAHPGAAASTNAVFWKTVMNIALEKCQDTSSLDGPSAVAIPMLSLRLFANAFRGGPGSLEAVTNSLEDVLSCNAKFINSTNKNIRLSVATLLYNISYYIHLQGGPTVLAVAASQVVVQADSILKTKVYETEALVRTLVALGTIALSSKEAKETARSIFIVSLV